jgi:AcrR family transcriptional regulator
MREFKSLAGRRNSSTKGERTREKILRAAESTFGKVGYERATLREVAKVAGIHQPGIYNYFKTKRHLYEAILSRMLHPLLTLLDEVKGLPPREQHKSVTKLVDLIIENRNISSLLVRAFLSTNKTERDLAVHWMEQVMSNSPRRAMRKGGALNVHEILKDMAILNAWLGYFWTAPVIEKITKRKGIADAELLDAQKELLLHMMSRL